MDPSEPVGTPLPEPLSASQATQIPPPPPFFVGLKAARANLVPGLFLQALMLAVIFAYFRLAWARPWFDRLGEVKRTAGTVFTVVSAVIAGAVLPELLKLCCLQRRLPGWRDAGDFLFAACFYTVNALCVEQFYHWQNVWFGTAATLAVLLRKVAVDQFAYTPIFSAPLAVACFAWKNQGDAPVGVRNLFTASDYVRRIVPTLVANWIVWIPVVAVLYSLPPLLQIPIYSFALCFWALMLAYIHATPTTAP